ncbi:MAG TPA: MFS transporter, partial [Ktedonobacteraceae bacterium]|nr:MFS transporter [Ktedonobacteraceae bacterium]
MSLETTIPDVSDAQKTQETPPTRLFKNRNFGLLAIGQAISIIGDFVYSTTLLVWVFVLTHSAAAVSGVLVAQYVPIFLLGPVAGVFVDRWNRRTTMIATTLLQMGVALLPLLIP